MDAALRDLLQQQVTIEPFTSRNDYGAATYGAPVPYPCRVVEDLQMLRQPDGSQKLARHKVTLDGDAVVDPRDRLTLPDGTVPRILAVERYPDETGTIYTVLVRTE